ncbi:uroporphyrinogen-III decarboxylase [Desulfosporosinus orientis DSM 765]|uniref:Uroporphyrinogen-III decarboxylase n=1 Tax=Desulfosporosinus orientis (strain ATCC 19365 / DSM 765 / NCIMB 8382 / VKM B-1628 / Singapore I) TaxID=768706 RepID=G7WDI1_DESOD|nr:uroporphyrinogen decarboxylase family protein [Desulfosporosinus orientis]AET67950.1 uroporphyrinogen-III decarboxylase [Desulfosporosinus orientis DSM 765]
MDTAKLFEERVKRFVETTNHQEPDRVPILSNIETWAISYAGATVHECLESHEKEFEIFAKPFQDIYFDGTLGFSMNRAMKLYSALGSNAYFVSNDGTTLQHQEISPMQADEYDAFIEDPIKFTRNVLFKRKYPALNKPYPENKQALKAAALELVDFGAKLGNGAAYLKEKLGIPVTSYSLVISPMDILFDYMRGFVGATTDLRRNPEKVKASTEKLAEFCMGISTGGAPKIDPFPWTFTPLHMPEFLSPKQFGEFYWPAYKKVLLAIHERGGKVYAFLEGSWERFYEFLQELPKSFLIAAFERDDVAQAKKALGDKITICGGMPLSLLRYGTKEECIDHAKKVVDACAPGGGFIFGTNLVLLSQGDVNPENYKAVNEFVHNYGVY